MKIKINHTGINAEDVESGRLFVDSDGDVVVRLDEGYAILTGSSVGAYFADDDFGPADQPIAQDLGPIEIET